MNNTNKKSTNNKFSNTKERKASFYLYLFGLIFFLSGLVPFIIGLIPVYKSYQTQNWQEHYATINHITQIRSYKKKSVKYGVKGQYSYAFNKQPFQSSQFSFFSGVDNIGSYQQDLYNELYKKYNEDKKIKIYINSQKPSEAIYDRNIRWEQLAVHSMFLILFGSVGIGIMLLGRHLSNESDKDKQIRKAKGLRVYRETNLIFWAACIITAVWSIISLIVSLNILINVLEKQNYWSLLLLIIPLIGLVLIGLTTYLWLKDRKFKDSFLEIESKQLNIGELNRGYLSIPAKAMCNDEVLITISCIKTIEPEDDFDDETENFSEDDTESEEETDVLWQNKQRVMPKKGINGTLESHFSCRIPDDLPESDDDDEDIIIEWEVSIEQHLKDVSFNHTYDVPAFKA